MGRHEGIYYYYEVLTPLREKIIEYLSSPMTTIRSLIWGVFILIILRLIVDIFIHTKIVKNILRNKSLILYFYKLKYRFQGKSALKLHELTDAELKEKLEILLECREQNLTFHYTSRKKCDNLREIVELISNCRLRQLEEDFKKRAKTLKKTGKNVNSTKKGKNNKESKGSASQTESDGKESNLSKKRSNKNKKDDDRETSTTSNNEEKSDVKEEEKEDDQDERSEDKNKKKKKGKKKDKKEEEEDDGEESNDDKSNPNINLSILLDSTQDVIGDDFKDIYSLKDLVTCKSEDDFFKEDVFAKSKMDTILELLNKSIKNRKSTTVKRRNPGDNKEGDLLIPDYTQSESEKNDDGKTEDEVSVKNKRTKNAPKQQADFWIIKNMDDINDEISK